MSPFVSFGAGQRMLIWRRTNRRRGCPIWGGGLSLARMGKRAKRGKSADAAATYNDDVRAALDESLTPHAGRVPSARPSALLDTRVIYCGDCLEQLKKLP